MTDGGGVNSPLLIGFHKYVGYVGFEFTLQMTFGAWTVQCLFFSLAQALNQIIRLLFRDFHFPLDFWTRQTWNKFNKLGVPCVSFSSSLMKAQSPGAKSEPLELHSVPCNIRTRILIQVPCVLEKSFFQMPSGCCYIVRQHWLVFVLKVPVMLHSWCVLNSCQGLAFSCCSARSRTKKGRPHPHDRSVKRYRIVLFCGRRKLFSRSGPKTNHKPLCTFGCAPSKVFRCFTQMFWVNSLKPGKMHFCEKPHTSSMLNIKMPSEFHMFNRCRVRVPIVSNPHWDGIWGDVTKMCFWGHKLHNKTKVFPTALSFICSIPVDKQSTLSVHPGIWRPETQQLGKMRICRLATCSLLDRNFTCWIPAHRQSPLSQHSTAWEWDLSAVTNQPEMCGRIQRGFTASLLLIVQSPPHYM